MKKESRLLILGLISLLALLPTTALASDEIGLEAPPIGALAEGDSFLTAEAGISAYGQATSVDLELARNGFKTIEKETEDYIVGSVAVDGYDEAHDVHVYIDSAGWLVAYYLIHELPGKIVDWVNYDGVNISATKLKVALDNVLAAQFQLPFAVEVVKYFHFGYPAATRMLIVTDEKPSPGSEYFYITVPVTGLNIYQRSWAHALRNTGSATYSGNNLYVEDELLSSITIPGATWKFAEGNLTPLQLYAGYRIPISLLNRGYNTYLNCLAAIVILYSEL